MTSIIGADPAVLGNIGWDCAMWLCRLGNWEERAHCWMFCAHISQWETETAILEPRICLGHGHEAGASVGG